MMKGGGVDREGGDRGVRMRSGGRSRECMEEVEKVGWGG